MKFTRDLHVIIAAMSVTFAVTSIVMTCCRNDPRANVASLTYEIHYDLLPGSDLIAQYEKVWQDQAQADAIAGPQCEGDPVDDWWK